MIEEISFEDFLKVDIRVGTIIQVKPFLKAKKPAYQLWIDFGEDMGIKKSSAQITEQYHISDLLNTQVLAVVNFPKKQIADFMSEVLVLGFHTSKGVILSRPESLLPNGKRLL